MLDLQDPARIEARRWWTLGVLCLSLVLVVAGNSSLNVALPTIVKDLDASNAQLQWIVDAYSLVFAGLLLPMGALGDRFGRKGLLQVGLSVFALGAVLATLATEPAHLIATRALMGAGGAMIMPATLSIITNVFPPHERARAIAVWAGFAGAGAAIGPVMSGVLLEHFWFGSVFLINVPIVILALVLGFLLVPTSSDPEHRRLDPVAAVLSMIGLSAVLFAIIEAPDHGWTSVSTVVGFGVGLAFLGGFVLWELRSDHPMLPIDQFADRRFSMGAGAIGLAFFTMFGLFFIATQYLQFVLGYSPLQAGLATLPMALMMIVSAPRSAPLSQRFGRNRVMAGGLVLIAVGMLVMTTLEPTSPYAQFVVALVLFGAGMGFAMAPATGAIMESMALGKAGVGSAVNDTTREIGGSLGVAVLGSLLSSGYRSALTDSLAGLPQALQDGAKESVGAALGIAAQAPGEVGSSLTDAAQHAFTDAMGLVFFVAAAVAAGAAVLVYRVMPERPNPTHAHDSAHPQQAPAPN